MSWEAIGAAILVFVCLLLVLYVWLVWRLYREVGEAEEKRITMDKQSFEGGIKTPLGSAGVTGSGSLREGVQADVSASLTPTGSAVGAGVGGALAYEALLGLAGVWTVPLIAGLAGGIWLWKKQKAAKAAKAHPAGPGAL